MGGRVKGKKNLKREGNAIVNQQGVKFTEEEKKKLESLVNRANQKRKKILSDEHDLVKFFGGRSTGKKVGETTGLMGDESDFVLAKKSKSLNRFKSKKEFNKYIKNLEKVTNANYLDKRAREYKKNHIKALQNVFGADANPIVKKLRYMKIKDYVKMVQRDEAGNISYVYDPVARNHKLEQIKGAYGIDEKSAEDTYLEYMDE